MKIEINNITLNYLREGTGAPLILLHGNGEDHQIFNELIDKLKHHFTVYAIDSRNHGDSENSDDFSYETMANDVYCFVQKQELQNVSILGFSDGAILCTLIALEHPNIFSKMVLLGLNLKPTDFKQEILDELMNEYESTKSPLVKMMLEQPNIELESLKKINTPTLVIAAEDDIYKPDLYEDIVATLPNSELMIMKGHDHGSYIMNQNILYPDLIKFLKE